MKQRTLDGILSLVEMNTKQQNEINELKCKITELQATDKELLHLQSVNASTVFIIQDKNTGTINGCFASHEKAAKYIANSDNFALFSLDVTE